MNLIHFYKWYCSTSETNLNIHWNINLDNVCSNGSNSGVYSNMDDMSITELVSCLWANERLINY